MKLVLDTKRISTSIVDEISKSVTFKTAEKYG